MIVLLGATLVAVLTEKLGPPRPASASAQERAFLCPWPHTKNGRTIQDTTYKLAVNIQTGHWICNVCRHSGRDPSYLLRTLGIEPTSYSPPPVPDLPSTVAQTLARACSRRRRVQSAPPRPPRIDYPCPTYPIAQGTTEWRYLRERRGLSEETITTLRLCVGTGPWRHRVFFPVVDHAGYMTYWTARDFGDPPARNKYDTPDPRDYPDGLSREYTIYRQYPFYGFGLADGVDITEGALSAVGCGPSGVALLGKEWTATQLIALAELPTPCYYVALDGDARAYAVELARVLSDVVHPRPVLVVPIPDGQDPDSIRHEYRKLRANALPHHDIRLLVGNT